MAWGWSGVQQNKIKGFAHPSYENAVCLFLQPPLSSRNGLLNKVAQWQGWRFCTGSSTWTSTHRGRPGCLHCWVTRLLAAETNVKPRKWLRFWGDRSLPPLPSLTSKWLLTCLKIESTLQVHNSIMSYSDMCQRLWKEFQRRILKLPGVNW